MKLYKVGESSKAVCPFCKGIRSATFQERDVPLESGKGVVSGVLAAVCDSCEKVISIPQQSVPRIKDAIAKVREPVEARIPRHLSDVLVLSSSSFGDSVSRDTQLILFRYFLLRIASSRKLSSRIITLAKSDDAKGPASARLSVNLNSKQMESLEALKRSSHLGDSEIARGVLVQMKHDLLDRPKKSVVKDLRQMMALVG